jgi:alanyl-tRNA synthetase
MMSSTEIRKKFLEFFQTKGHTIVPSAPIVVKNDPTLLFTNAGMNQFKDYFLGNRKPQHIRVADTQKCLRVSGKHNDLEEVGVDTYHHTMFEMLGNWSFGDYFKKEAIAWAWELLTEIYKIDKKRLYITVFEGDDRENLPRDEEAILEWKKWVDEDRIIMGKKKDNFWEMGDTGPCGPCTEIHFDCRAKDERENSRIDPRTLINTDDPRVIEIWNVVFIQFNRLKDGRLDPLPSKHVDTGMGFERLVRVLQDKESNYDTDIFTATIESVEQITKKKYKALTTSTEAGWGEAVAFRVIADHIRAIAFTIADGQLPSNTGAGYVIRRILRRAVRYYYSNLDYKQPLLYQLIPVISKQFENVFPELNKQADFVSKVIKEEEEAFLRTLDKGLKRIDDIVRSSISANSQSKVITGKDAFELFDTYGFPLDLTKLIAAENSLFVDEVGFDSEMGEQKKRSRAATTIDTEDWIEVNKNGSTKFIGYTDLETKTRVSRYRKIKAKGKESFQLVLEKTPFYAESGGQVGDTGTLDFGNESIEVLDTKKENELIIHFTQKLPAELDDDVWAKVDATKRKDIAIHHSATHLLHAALRNILGNHVIQKGSLVNEEHLRFDFSHFAKLSDEELKKIEELVNEKIRENIPVIIQEMSKDEAIRMGAMALFGEKYGDKVRVVIIDPKYSIELCGGTHVGATGEIGFFKIKHEAAVAAGVRRIEAVAGKIAEEFVQEQFSFIRSIREALKNPSDILKSVENITTENNEFRKKIESLEMKQLNTLKDQLLQEVSTVQGISFIGQQVEVSSADALKKLGFDLRSDLKKYVVMLTADISGKAAVLILVDDQTAADKNLDASKIIKEHIAPLIKGGGGGQKTLATAGGQDTSKLKGAIEKVKSLLE